MEIPPRITREWLNIHPDVAVIYGTTALGYVSTPGTPESELMSCKNAFSVPVKNSFCASGGKYFDDNGFYLWKPTIDDAIGDLYAITRNYKYIIYIPHIGLGGSCLKKYGPKVYDYIISELDKFCHNKQLGLR